ncbi:MAG: MFS transporter, partial [Acinetobacter sp.]
MSNIYLLFFSLYWAQGLPVGFMTHALPVILRANGVSLTQIGGFGLLMLPWAIKFLWSPWVDRYGSSRWGHYRVWIISTQVLTIITLILISFMSLQSLQQHWQLAIFFYALLCMNTIGATQDIATDGLAVKQLRQHQQSWGNTFQVIGSRLGFIVGGGAVLWAMDWLKWQNTFLLLAFMVAFNTIPILFFQESKVHLHATKLTTPIRQTYIRYFFQNKTMHTW